MGPVAVAVAGLLGAGMAGPSTRPAPTDAVAVVTSVAGMVTVAAPGRDAGALTRRFDWLAPESRLTVGDGGHLALAFSSGRRYELKAGARATVTASGLDANSGSVRVLDPMPPMPSFPRIEDAVGLGQRAGAIRIRHSGRVRLLYPRQDVRTIAGQTTLSFAPVDGPATYTVQVDDAAGRSVHQAETTAPAVLVPADALQPGTRYFWSVKATGPLGVAFSPHGSFTTLAAPAQGQRNVLRSFLTTSGGDDCVPLMAEIDRRLGLLAEARDGFRAALARSPGDASLQRAVAEVERRLGEPRVAHR